MSVDTFKRELWETAILEEFRSSALAHLVCTSPTSVEGKRAYFNSLGDIEVQDYEGTVDFADIETTEIHVDFDQKKYFAIKLDDVDKAQIVADVMLPMANKGAYGMKKKLDEEIIADFVANAKTKKTSKEIATPEEAYNMIVDLGTALDELDVPEMGRYVMASPEFINMLAKDKRVVDNTEVLANGVVVGMQINGMQIVKTTRVSKGNVLAVHSGAMCLGVQIDKMEAIRLENSFGDAIKSLFVYGKKLLRPEAVALGQYTISVE